jgi:hypothetical protein
MRKLLDQDCAVVWQQPLSLPTEHTYVQLVKRYIASIMRENTMVLNVFDCNSYHLSFVIASPVRLRQ